jgi:hypothetical protein
MDASAAASSSAPAASAVAQPPSKKESSSSGVSFMDVIFAHMKAQNAAALNQAAKTSGKSAAKASDSPSSSTDTTQASSTAKTVAKTAGDASDAASDPLTAAINGTATADDSDSTDDTATLDQSLTLSGSTLTVADLQKILKDAEAQSVSDHSNATGADATGTDASQQATLNLAILSPKGKQQLLSIIQNLLKGTPAADQPTVETLENGVLKKLDVTDLTASKAAATDSSATLIVSGLSPQQLTDIVKKLAGSGSNDGTDTTAAASAAGSLMVGLVQIQPASLKKDALFQPRSSVLPAQGASPQPTSPQNLMAAAAAAQTANSAATPSTKSAAGEDTGLSGASGAKGSAQKPEAPSSAPDDDEAAESGADASDGLSASGTQNATVNGLTSADGKTDGKTGGFDQLLRMFETAKQQEAFHTNSIDNPGSANAGATDKAASQSSSPTAVNSALQATGQTVAGSLTASIDPSVLSPDAGTAIAAQAQTAFAGQIMTLSPTAAMTNLITAAPQAIYAHPATQQVAAAMVKSSTSASSTELSIMLDPAELGKISVKLEFSKYDKAVKAVVSADKPETFLMLSRDSNVLQQSLKNAGIDTGANGLTFQLSQDGGASGQNNQSNQGNRGNDQNSGSDDDSMTIETRMDWSVDSTTGSMHYNVLA